MSVMDCYKYFLKAEMGVLVVLVDLYNAGRLSPNARKALEIIDGLPMDD